MKLNKNCAKILGRLYVMPMKLKALQEQSGLPYGTFAKEYGALWGAKYIKTENYFRFLSGLGLIALNKYNQNEDGEQGGLQP